MENVDCMRVLLIEDNEKISGLISENLRKAGFSSEPAFCADEAFSAIATSNFNMVILDLGLPDQDGLDILKKLRSERNSVPVLILTARDSLDEKINGLNTGADDYLTKPFAMEELIARVHALLRRPSEKHDLNLELSNVVFKPLQKQTEINGQIVKMSKRETMLLEMLLRSSGKTVLKENIEMQLYSYDEEGSTNSIEVLVHRLRKKLENENAAVEIHTLRGIGYMIAGKKA